MIDSEQYKYIETGVPPSGTLLARITAVHRERYELNEIFYGRLKTGIYYGAGGEIFPTVGDYVQYAPADGGDAQIIKTLPRKSQFIRRDPNPNVGEQSVAANFDYVFIMTSLNKDFSVNRISRYLALARQSGAAPVVILTKADIADDIDNIICAAQTVAGNAEIIPVSVVSGAGLDRLSDYLQPGKTIVFLGMSGVGKSSLLNYLMGQDVMAVNAIREDDSRGRHTTSHRQLFTLPGGAAVIDTPGMRSLGMWDVNEGISETFADVEALLGRCRFSDCRHKNEPGCAVRAAIDSGVITAGRWENYQKLKRESLYAEDKSAALQAKYARNKSIAKWSREMKKNGGIRK